MMVIGVTGGMASGKSTVARMFAGRGILHIDADKVVHELMHHDRTTIKEIGDAFPTAVQDGVIHRPVLAKIIGDNPASLATLETLLHPRVRSVEVRGITLAHRNRLRAVVLDIPLLFETDADQLCDVVIVAHAPLPHRRRRAFARPGMNETKWQRLLDRQMKDDERHQRADVIIHTTTGKAATRRHVAQLMKEWKLA